MARKDAGFNWQDKVGNYTQIGGIETSVLDNGPGRGTRIAWVNTGSGLRYRVIIDRGLDIADAKMVILKTASNFQFFQRWRNDLIRVDSPGTTQSDLTAFDWKHIGRPIYPLDALDEWRP